MGDDVYQFCSFAVSRGQKLEFLLFSLSFVSLTLSLSLLLFLFFSSTMVIISIFALCFYISFEFSFLVKVLFAAILFVILELEDIFDCKEKQIQQEREA